MNFRATLDFLADLKLVSARVDPTFDCVRDQQRFRELLERVGLP